MRIPSSIFSILLALLAAGSVRAQQTKVTLQFVSFPKSNDTEPVELQVGTGKTVMVELPSHELSMPYKVDASATWALGKTVEGKDGKAKFSPYGRAKSIGSAKQLILVLRKGKTREDGFKLIPFDNRPAKFGGGQFLFINTSTIDIAGEIGTRKFALKPGRSAVIRPKADMGKNLCHATLYYRNNTETKSFLDTNWPLQPDARGLIFIYSDPRSSRIRLHSIRDFP